MTVVGEESVREAHRRGRRKILVEPGAILTPQATDVADRLGVRVQRGMEITPPLSTDPGRALTRTLYRRHPGFVAPTRRPGLRADAIPRLAVVGAGGVGATLTHLAASAGTADEVVLVDILPGLAEMVAVDIAHAGALLGTRTRVRHAQHLSALAGADVVVLAPECARFDVAVGEVRLAAEAIATHASQAVTVLAARPCEVLATELKRAGNLAPERVLGTGATLASTRLVNAIAEAVELPRCDIEAQALGTDDGGFVAVLSAARVRGRLLRDVLRPELIEALVADAAAAAGFVAGLRTSRPPSIAPAHAALDVLDALRGDRPGPVPVSAFMDGTYGVEGVVLGVTAHLHAGGLRQIVELALEPAERSALAHAAERVRREVDDLIGR